MSGLALHCWEAWYVRSVDGQSIETLRLPVVAVSSYAPGGVALVMSPAGHLALASAFGGSDVLWVFVGVSPAMCWRDIEDVEFCGTNRSDSCKLVQKASAFALQAARLRKEVAGSP